MKKTNDSIREILLDLQGEFSRCIKANDDHIVKARCDFETKFADIEAILWDCKVASDFTTESYTRHVDEVRHLDVSLELYKRETNESIRELLDHFHESVARDEMKAETNPIRDQMAHMSQDIMKMTSLETTMKEQVFYLIHN